MFAVTDIWVPLKTARTCASRLSRLAELDGLLEWRSRSAFTIDDKEEGGLVSNWKIASDIVDPAQYSTAAMLAVRFPRVHLLPSGTQVRTFVPDERAKGKGKGREGGLVAGSYEEVWRRLLEETTREWEAWLEEDEDETEEEDDGRMRRELVDARLFSTTLSLLALSHALPPETSASTAPPGSILHIAPQSRYPLNPEESPGSPSGDLARRPLSPTSSSSAYASLNLSSDGDGDGDDRDGIPTELTLERHELKTGGIKARLALVDLMSRLAARDWIRDLEQRKLSERASDASPGPQADADTVVNGAGGDAGSGADDGRWNALLARVTALENTSGKGAPRAAVTYTEGAGARHSELEEEVDRLGARVEELAKQLAVARPRVVPPNPDWERPELVVGLVAMAVGALAMQYLAS